MDSLPDNSELDALYRRAADHPAVRPDFFRAMLEEELYTLVHRGQMEMPEDEPPPPQDALIVVEPVEGQPLEFIRWGQEQRQFHFVFTSVALAARALTKLGAARPMMVLAMPGRDLLQAMQTEGVGLALNPATGGGELLCNDRTLAHILDGTLLGDKDMAGSGDQERGEAMVLPPEDYPLALVQPLFEYLQTRPEVVAAWVMQPLTARQHGQPFYVFAILTTSDDTAELERTMMAILAMVDTSDRQEMEFAVSILDYGQPAHAAMMREQVPFYAAPGFKSPGQ